MDKWDKLGGYTWNEFYHQQGITRNGKKYLKPTILLHSVAPKPLTCFWFVSNGVVKAQKILWPIG